MDDSRLLDSDRASNNDRDNTVKLEQQPKGMPPDLKALKAQWVAAIAKGASSDPAVRAQSSDAHLERLARAIAAVCEASGDGEEAARWLDNVEWLKRNQEK